jgi:4-hydroxy-tetrahydrodipicolinate reductase
VGLFHAANFSLGIHLFSSLLKEAAKKLHPHYQVALHEEHHAQKIDAPSGTALSLLKHLPENTAVTSLRLGSIIGTHEVIFDSPFDQIRLCHQAKSREVFAAGALKAAEWLQGRKGTFTMEDLIHDL